MKIISKTMILVTGLSFGTINAAPLSVPGGLQSKSLNYTTGNFSSSKLKNKSSKIDSGVKAQLKKFFSSSKTPPMSGLDKAYKNLKSDITKLRRAQHVYNTGLDRCLGKIYTEREKREVSCERKQPQACARDLVNACMRKTSTDYSKAEDSVTVSSKKIEVEASKFVRERNLSFSGTPSSIGPGVRRALPNRPR